MSSPIPDEERFARQLRFSGLGAAGQERLAAARVALVGCGALGGVRKDLLAYVNGRFVLSDRITLSLNPYYQTLDGESFRYQDRARRLTGADPATLALNMPVALAFETIGDGFRLPVFTPAAGA